MRIALGLEYDGATFRGWQSQPGGATVQDVLEAALAEIAAQPVRVTAAGRTDAGVHATLQVVHFDTSAERPITAWTRGVNAHLPAAVAVLWAAAVAEDFHARFSATARHYTYVLQDRSARPALWADHVGWFHQPLDVDAMRAAAECLPGTHDFSAFRAAECQASTPIRTMTAIDIAREGEVVLFHFNANAYLHHMIRNIVGALVQVGAGRRAPQWMRELLESRDRTRGAPTFAASGLYFTGAEYPAVYALPRTRGPVPLVS